jgi:hypothetical protein
MTDEEKFAMMKEFREDFDELPDGAFFALASERGWTVEDWVWFSEQAAKGRK